MNIIITMAGLSERFKIAGYEYPKYKIPITDYTMFELAVMSLSGFNELTPLYIFIVQKKDDSCGFIAEKCKKLNIKNFIIKELDFITDGQATTATLVKDLCCCNDSTIIYNIDTFFDPKQLSVCDIKGDGFIPCCKMDGSHWSFVETDEFNRAVCITEKERISDNCSIGLYYFSSYSLFIEAYNEFYFGNRNNRYKEKYIAPIYNFLIEKQKEVYISNISAENVFIFGTPEELEISKKRLMNFN